MSNVQENREAWVSMLKDPANDGRKSRVYLVTKDKQCCAMGLWLWEKHPEIAQKIVDAEDPEMESEEGYQLIYDDLGIGISNSTIWRWNDGTDMSFAQIAERIEVELGW